MPDDTPILRMPYILPSQAQKHVTHNEALRILDVVVQLIVTDRDQTTPPPAPIEADRHIVPPLATGAWSGKTGQIALREHGQWSFFPPETGWQAFVSAEGVMAVYDGGAWVTAAERPFTAMQIGVSASPDAVNRLSVSAPATLLNHAGGGHQVKVNKAAPIDTASLLFQTGFSGRAEMGLAGNDDFTVKISPDGTGFLTGIAVDATSGVLTAPMGLRAPGGTAAVPGLAFAAEPGLGLARGAAGQMQLCAGGAVRAQLTATGLAVSVPVTGTAVTQSTTDTTSGRLLRVGDYGLGTLTEFTGNIDTVSSLPSGFVRVLDAATGAKPSGATTFNMVTLRRGTASPFANSSQLALVDGSNELLSRAWNGTAWTVWRSYFNGHNIVGTVAQSGGVPTGAVIERGSNANGSFTRFADGTQMCRHSLTSSASAAVTWTYPAAFSAVPVAGALVVDSDPRIATCANRLAASVDINVFTIAGARAASPVEVTAWGHWF